MLKKVFFKILSFIMFFLIFAIFAYSFSKDFKITSLPNNANKKILISGSSITQPLCEELGAEYLKNNTKTYFNKSSIGSADALTSVLNNTSNIGDLSKNLNEEEKSKVNVKTFALDGIIVCVNPENKIENLTIKDLQKIFSGEIKNWKQLGGKDEKIVLVGRDSASGIRESFEKILNLKNKVKYNLELDNNGKVKFKLQKEKKAIGYVSCSTLDKNIKPIKINGITPNFENILNLKYPFFQPLCQITKKNVKDLTVEDWFSFVDSEKGANIIKKNKFIPLNF